MLEMIIAVAGGILLAIGILWLLTNLVEAYDEAAVNRYRAEVARREQIKAKRLYRKLVREGVIKPPPKPRLIDSLKHHFQLPAILTLAAIFSVVTAALIWGQ